MMLQHRSLLMTALLLVCSLSSSLASGHRATLNDMPTEDTLSVSQVVSNQIIQFPESNDLPDMAAAGSLRLRLRSMGAANPPDPGTQAAAHLSLIEEAEASLLSLNSELKGEQADITLYSIFSAFCITAVSEMGDRSFMMATILALRYGRGMVFLGTIVALTSESFISSGIGALIQKLPSRVSASLGEYNILPYCVAALLFVFGLAQLAEGLAVEHASTDEDDTDRFASLADETDKGEPPQVILDNAGYQLQDDTSVIERVNQMSAHDTMFMTARQQTQDEDLLLTLASSEKSRGSRSFEHAGAGFLKGLLSKDGSTSEKHSKGSATATPPATANAPPATSSSLSSVELPASGNSRRSASHPMGATDKAARGGGKINDLDNCLLRGVEEDKYDEIVTAVLDEAALEERESEDTGIGSADKFNLMSSVASDSALVVKDSKHFRLMEKHQRGSQLLRFGSKFLAHPIGEQVAAASERLEAIPPEAWEPGPSYWQNRFNIFWRTLVLVFMSEIGDTSMVVTATLASANSPIGVFIGASIANIVINGIGILAGSIGQAYISEKHANLVAAFMFFTCSGITAVNALMKTITKQTMF